MYNLPLIQNNKCMNNIDIDTRLLYINQCFPFFDVKK